MNDSANTRATMRAAPRNQIGLALGAWGAVQATAAGLAVAIGGMVRDAIVAMSEEGRFAPADAYMPVFAAEAILLAAAFFVLIPLIRRKTRDRRTLSEA